VGKGSDKSALTDGPIALMDSVFMRARILSRSITAIYDDKLRPFGITAAQFILLSRISRGPITRADIARLQQLGRSTLTRNLRTILFEGLVEEVREHANGRTRPLALTATGIELLLNAQPEWLAAEAHATELLGKDAMLAVISIADHLANRPAVYPSSLCR
jgi:DNA-binding MarR family transcriptional regulator